MRALIVPVALETLGILEFDEIDRLARALELHVLGRVLQQVHTVSEERERRGDERSEQDISEHF